MYCGYSAADLAATLPDGTSLSDYIQVLLNRTASDIVYIVGYDKTQNQTIRENFIGNDLNYHDTHNMIVSISSLFYWDPENPALGYRNFGIAGLAIDQATFYRVQWDNGLSFTRGYEFVLSYLVKQDGLYTVTGWPTLAYQVQIEMVSQILQESGAGAGTLGESHVPIGNAEQIIRVDMRNKWLRMLRPIRRYA